MDNLFEHLTARSEAEESETICFNLALFWAVFFSAAHETGPCSL